MLHSVARLPLANYLRCCTSTNHLRKVPRTGGLSSSQLGFHTATADCCSFSSSSPLLFHSVPSPPASPQHQPSHPLAATQVR
uniref:Uncharacterized protein n=1 Tax=Anopheles culicifacies TaxID=139723 RepID=A0A182MLW3_9DIPT